MLDARSVLPSVDKGHYPRGARSRGDVRGYQHHRVHMFASLLEIDAAAWSAAIAAGSLAVSIWLGFRTRGSTAASRQSADSSERSAEAAEASAAQAERAAAAAERSASAHEGAVAFEEERAQHERRERIDRDAPRWGPSSEQGGELWFSGDDELRGAVRNTGRVRADVSAVELELPTGGRLAGRYRAEPAGPADGGYVSSLAVRPGGAMRVEFHTRDGSLGQGLRGDARPRVVITSSSEELRWTGERTLELLRKLPGHQPAPRWQLRRVD